MSEFIDGYECEMPKDWAMTTIDNLATRVGSGVTPRGGSEVYKDDGVVFIRSQNVRFEGLDLSDVAYIDDKTHHYMRASEVLPFDVLLNITGASIGRCCFVPDGFAYANQNQHVCTIRLPAPCRADAKYLSSVLASPIGQHQIIRLNAGGNREGLNYQQLRSFRIPWPTSLIRSKIARILTTVDNLIEQTEALIEKQKSIKQGMMHDLFTRGVDSTGRLRPPYEDAPHLYNQSPLGWIPKEWEAATLGNALQAAGGFLQTGPFGSQLHAHEYVSDGVPVIMPQDIIEGRITIDAIARITEEKAQSLARHRVRRNDIVFSRRGDLSRSAAILEHEIGWFCGTGCFLLRVPKEALDAQWLSHIYRYPLVQRQVDANAVGSTMPSLNNAVMKNLSIPFPNVVEQKEVRQRLDALDQKSRTEQLRRDKLLLEKNGLMQDLLTGKVRVKVNEAEEVTADV